MSRMWTRELLKTRAKDVLRRNYWMILLACLIFGFLGSNGSNGGSAGSFIGVYAQALSNSISFSVSAATIIALLTIMFILIAASYVYKIFVGNVIHVGLCRYLMEARQNQTNLGALFWAFQEGRYLKIVKTMFFYDLYIFLWSLLFVIPGFVKAYQYYYVPFILAENPDLQSNRVLQLSRNMTNGEKGDIFVLNLSFLGWSLLGLLACCIGSIFVTPYIAATDAELYAFVRDRSIAQNITNTFELRGFPSPLPPGYRQQF